MGERSNAPAEAPAGSVLRRRWLNALGRSGVVTVAHARALSEEQLKEILHVGPKSIADIVEALVDPKLVAGDSLEQLRPARVGLASERDCELLWMRETGIGIGALARRFGISRVRVRQILDRHACP